MISEQINLVPETELNVGLVQKSCGSASDFQGEVQDGRVGADCSGLEGGEVELFGEVSERRERKEPEVDAFEEYERVGRAEPSQLSSHIEHPMSSIIDSLKSSQYQNNQEYGNDTYRSSMRQNPDDTTRTKEAYSKVESESKNED